MDPNLPPPSSTRKVKFAPKGPPRRKKQNSVQPKTEGNGNDEANDNEAAEAILRKVNERLTRQKPKTEKKVAVAFAHGVASPTSTRTVGKPKELTINPDSTPKDDESYDKMDIDSLPTLPSSTGSDLAEISVNNSDSLLKRKKKEYKEPWDYHHSNYPTTLPLRRPYAGDPEILDEAEFGKAAANAEYDENNVHAASELGLLEKKDDVQILFLQLPANLPLGKWPASTGGRDTAGGLTLPGDRSDKAAELSSPMLKGKEVAGSAPRLPASAKGKEIIGSSTISRRHNTTKNIGSLQDLPAGSMGKMLVYKSGTVKLKLGDILYNVSPGVECSFAQDVVAINTAEKQCCQLGELGKRAVVTPDVDFLLDKMIKLS
ncbi:DNA-directed RNA polymerase III subunit RPC4 isoform X2 [Capsicum galapagoense]